MNILDRYITSEYLKYFFVSLLGIVGLFLAADSLRISFSTTTPGIIIAKYYMYMIPELAVRIIPIACLIAVLLSLSFMNRKNELVAMYAGGVSLMRISYVIMTVTLVISALSFVVQDRVVPQTSKEKTIIYYREIKGRKDFSTTIKLSRIWYRSKNIIYNIENMDFGKNMLYGMSLYFFNDRFDMVQYIEAKEAEYKSGNDWILRDGRLTVFENGGRRPMSKNFDTKKIILTETPKDFREIEKEVDSLKLKELYSFIKRTKDAGFDTKTYEVKFHSRLSIGIVPMIMAFLGIPFATRSSRHSSAAKEIGVAVFFAFGFWLLFSVGISLGNRGVINPALSAWIANIVFAIIGTYIVVKEGR